MENKIVNGSGIVIIRTVSNVKRRKPVEPQQHLWKTMKEHEYRAYVASLDCLDKACTRKSVIPQRAEGNAS